MWLISMAQGNIAGSNFSHTHWGTLQQVNSMLKQRVHLFREDLNVCTHYNRQMELSTERSDKQKIGTFLKFTFYLAFKMSPQKCALTFYYFKIVNKWSLSRACPDYVRLFTWSIVFLGSCKFKYSCEKLSHREEKKNIILSKESGSS